MATGAWRFGVFRQEGQECTPALWQDGGARYKVGLDRDRTLAAAIREAEECAEAEPDARFVVLDPAGEVMLDLEPAGACPF